MLVLTRKADEQILIGDDIKITLVRIKGGSVRVGIDAPRDVRVVRAELEKLDNPSTDKSSLKSSPRDKAASKTDHYADMDPVAEVFAHPQPKRGKKKTKGTTNRIITMIGDQPNADREVLVGKASADGSNVKMKRAPLSSYVSAS